MMKLRGGNGPTMRIAQLSDVAELNADPSRSATIFGLNSQAASAVNALLDAINGPRFPTRAPNSMPEGWSFGVSGFVYTAPEPPAEILP